LETIGKDVAEIPDIQRKLLANDADLKFLDRVAHQYQIAGGRVVLQIANDLPEALYGVGLFQPGVRYNGIVESPPDWARRTWKRIRIS
jgi:hypothetical protein